MREKGGRPRKSAALKKSEWINFRVTLGEADAVCKAAIKAGKTVGDYLLSLGGFRDEETPDPFQYDEPVATLRTVR